MNSTSVHPNVKAGQVVPTEERLIMPPEEAKMVKINREEVVEIPTQAGTLKGNRVLSKDGKPVMQVNAEELAKNRSIRNERVANKQKDDYSR